MNNSFISSLVCPETKQPLHFVDETESGGLVTHGEIHTADNKHKYSIIDGIPDLTYPGELRELDQEFMKKYNENANAYDEGMDWLFNSFYENEDDVRSKLIGLLNLQPNFKVLNVGCGTGGDSSYILSQLGADGHLTNYDLSSGLIRIAQEKLGPSSENLEYVIGNGSSLPFPDKTFDAVFHFGGINMFSEKEDAILEMTRVAKHNGRVVFGDESAAPWLSEKQFGKIIKTANPLYEHVAPMELLPENAQEVSLHYLLGNSFYAISYVNGDQNKLNLDLPIPGKRGGSLRSRYESKHGNI